MEERVFSNALFTAYYYHSLLIIIIHCLLLLLNYLCGCVQGTAHSHRSIVRTPVIALHLRLHCSNLNLDCLVGLPCAVILNLQMYLVVHMGDCKFPSCSCPATCISGGVV
jgi:hypothetical protein